MSGIHFPNDDGNYPQPKEWANVMTQDGTIYPATYDADKKAWVPMFRGGKIESLMHGTVVFWCPKPEGYPFARCDKGHGYLKTPDNAVCPTCKRFGFIKQKEEKPVKAETKPVDEVPAEVQEKPEAVAEEKPAEEVSTAKKRGGRKKLQ